MTIIRSLLLIAILAGCTASADPQEEQTAADEPEQAAPVEIGDVDAESVEAPDFDGCTDDCSGHQAGFDWAQENDLTDESECGGNSQSFIDGCEQFVQARQAEADAETEAAQEDAQTSDDQ